MTAAQTKRVRKNMAVDKRYKTVLANRKALKERKKK